MSPRYDPERYLLTHPNPEAAIQIRKQMDELSTIIEKMNARQHSGNKVIVMAATMFLTSSLAYSLYQFNDVNTTLNACLPSIFQVLNYPAARRILCGMARLDLLPVDYASEDPYLIRNVKFGSRHPKTRPMRVCVPIGLSSGIDVDCDGPASFIKQGFGFVEIGPVSLDETPPQLESQIQVLPRGVVSSKDRSEGSIGLSSVSQRVCDYIEYSRPNDLLSRNSLTGVCIKIKSQSDIDTLFKNRNFSRLFSTIDYMSLDVQEISDPALIAQMVKSITNASSHHESLPPIFLKINLSQSFPPSQDVVDSLAESPTLVGVSIVGSGVMGNDKARFNMSDDLVVFGDLPREKAIEAVANWYTLLKPFGKQIMASGGVVCGKDALNLIEAGASMINVYSGYVCNGPRIARDIKTQLSVQFMNKGYYNLDEAIGGKFGSNKRRLEAMKRRKKF